MDIDLTRDVAGDSSTDAEILLGQTVQGQLSPINGDSSDAFAVHHMITPVRPYARSKT